MRRRHGLHCSSTIHGYGGSVGRSLDMDGLRDPVGGKPPEIYWRRRIVAAIGVVLVVVVIYFLASSPGGTKKVGAIELRRDP